jgi:pimeloyl-ACP methyl ester carboxylesterase
VTGRLARDGVTLALDQQGDGDPPVVLVHGMACHRGFLAPQAAHLARRHRVLAVDLRGHGESDAPEQRHTTQGFADDLHWTCAQLGLERPVVVGHSLGGLVALELAAQRPGEIAAVVLVDSVLVPRGDRAGVVRELVAGLRTDAAEDVLRTYFSAFFGPFDEPSKRTRILDEAVGTPLFVPGQVNAMLDRFLAVGLGEPR